MKHLSANFGRGLALLVLSGLPALADEQAAIDGCIDRLRAEGGPDGQGGEVLQSDYSQAGTYILLRDLGGTVWRCIGYDDGSVGELVVQSAADDGAGAMAGHAGAEYVSGTEVLHFAKGANSAVLKIALRPGDSVSYVLGAKANQMLDVFFEDGAERVTYQIFNPDRSFLLDQVPGTLPYSGQLWQSGDHVIEVINPGASDLHTTVTFVIN